MSLITCPECAKSVSNRASACPHCGAPVLAAVRTIEATGKDWKALKLLSLFLAFVAVLCLTTFGLPAGAARMPEATGIASFLLVVSLALYLYATFGSWWHHR